MATLHFLNVGHGDCTLLKHGDGRNTVVDVCNARSTVEKSYLREFTKKLVADAAVKKGITGNFHQKDYPVNPIEYLQSFGETSIHRFILTHPDMDHMDGLKAVFATFSPANFWDSDNCKEIEAFDESRYDSEDWDLYKSLRAGKRADVKRLTLFSGSKGHFYNRNEDGTGGGNGLHVLSPTEEIVANANECEDFNDCSYVLLWKVGGKRVIIGGDSHDVSWEHILNQHQTLVENADLLIAPHHGRDSNRSYDFLKVVNPTLTFFGVARSEHLGYGAWSSRGLEVMTNNQGNCFVVDFTQGRGDVYCTNGSYAEVYRREYFNDNSFFNERFKAWYLKSI
jgi:competence protein ComEC